MVTKPLLLFAYGNISRGDDALAPLVLEQLQQRGLTRGCSHPIRYLTDYQILIEHALDLRDCERVVLIDAHQSLQQPFCFQAVTALQETSYTTHGITPSTLLHIYQQLFHEPAPVTAMLAIQGIHFELGQPPGERAKKNLEDAVLYLSKLLEQSDFSLWDAEIAPKTSVPVASSN